MYVYRFERNGIGPYIGGMGGGILMPRITRRTRSQKNASRFFERQLSTARVYRIDNFSKAHRDKKYIFGCSSKESLRAYFGGNFKPLFKQGYRIKRYKVPNDELVDMAVEVAFPVKYHKAQTIRKINELSGLSK